VKDPELVTVGESGHQDVDWRHAMVSSACQLALSIDRASLDRVIDSCPGERKQLGDEITMIRRGPR